MDAVIASAQDRELEAKHRALWALGDYTTIASEVVAPLGPELVAAAGIGADDRVLDVAAGTGNAAFAAAATGASVVGSVGKTTRARGRARRAAQRSAVCYTARAIP